MADEKKSASSEKMVLVEVARGKSIQKRMRRGGEATASDPIKTFLPGEKVEVPERELSRLIARGVVVDPSAKALPKDAADVDISGYFKSEGSQPTITQRG